MIAVGPILVLAMSVAGIIVAILIRRGRAGGDQPPSCGQCGYLVKGLTTFTCPECGSDLREVGIVVAGHRKALSPLARGILWTVALPIPALLITSLLMAVGPQIHRQSVRRTLTPASGAYAQVMLNSDAEGSTWSTIRARELTFLITPNTSAATTAILQELKLHAAESNYEYVDAAGRRVSGAGGLSAQVILDWMKAAGVDVTDPRVQTEANELMTQAQAISSGGANTVATSSFTNVSQSSSGSSGPALWLTTTLVAFWLVFWLAGLWYLVRKKPASTAPPA